MSHLAIFATGVKMVNSFVKSLKNNIGNLKSLKLIDKLNKPNLKISAVASHAEGASFRFFSALCSIIFFRK